MCRFVLAVVIQKLPFCLLGLVLMDNVNWLSFHSGYDFGYLLKILTCQNLPVVSSFTTSRPKTFSYDILFKKKEPSGICYDP